MSLFDDFNSIYISEHATILFKDSPAVQMANFMFIFRRLKNEIAILSDCLETSTCVSIATVGQEPFPSQQPCRHYGNRLWFGPCWRWCTVIVSVKKFIFCEFFKIYFCSTKQLNENSNFLNFFFSHTGRKRYDGTSWTRKTFLIRN